MYNEMKELFEVSNEEYLREQRKIIKNNVSEYTLCGQVMLHLNNFKGASKYSPYYLDVEYNRNYGGRIKTIKNEETYWNEKIRECLKALIRKSLDNIWTYNGTELPQNICRYVLGVYYEINTSRMEVEIEYYQDGELSHNYTVSIESIR